MLLLSSTWSTSSSSLSASLPPMTHQSRGEWHINTLNSISSLWTYEYFTRQSSFIRVSSSFLSSSLSPSIYPCASVNVRNAATSPIRNFDSLPARVEMLSEARMKPFESETDIWDFLRSLCACVRLLSPVFCISVSIYSGIPYSILPSSISS